MKHHLLLLLLTLAITAVFAQKRPPMMAEVNQPVGQGIGIHPGRVAWVHAPGVANWDGETGLWVEDRWNDQSKADQMVAKAIKAIAGQKTTAKAWKAIFKDFNDRQGRGKRGYKAGETIAIKLNMNNALTHHDTIELNSSPFVTLALVKTLVLDASVRQQDIIVCEPSRAITDSIYDKCHRLFPAVRFVDNIGGDGREKCEYYEEQIHYSVDNGKMARGLAKCVVDADYLINSALLKTHSGPGVTLTAKNWYGATDISLFWRQNAHNHISQDKKHGTPQYKTFVDWMGHKDMGQKCLLFLIDGTYGSRDVNGKPQPKWQKAPFHDEWCCSIIASQDGVACDAVGMDMIINEWPNFKSLPWADEYLNEAANIPSPKSGTTYDPEGDGKPLTAPLGLFEHADANRHYTQLDLQRIEIPQQGLIADYDFSDVHDGIVPDHCGNFPATIRGCAHVEQMGDYPVLALGDNDGYLDLGAEIGKKLQQAKDFTIEVTYMVSDSASLKGQGYFLWAFSTLEENTKEEGQYHAYKLNAQRGENTFHGWNHETILHINKPSEQGRWMTVRYRQQGAQGVLTLNGEVVATNDKMFTMQETFPDQAPTYNWMGRAPFHGDNFLKGTYLRKVSIFME